MLAALTKIFVSFLYIYSTQFNTKVAAFRFQFLTFKEKHKRNAFPIVQPIELVQ